MREQAECRIYRAAVPVVFGFRMLQFATQHAETTCQLAQTEVLSDLKRIDAQEVYEKFFQLLEKTANTHEPLLITGSKSSAVLVNEGDWNAMRETVYLLSIPGMPDSIRAGMESPVEDCQKTPGW